MDRLDTLGGGKRKKAGVKMIVSREWTFIESIIR